MASRETVLKFQKVDDGVYDVLFRAALLGTVYRDANAWSYGNWFIEGDRKERAEGGVNGKTLKYLGFTDRARAARYLAIMQSGMIVASLDAEIGQ